ncbi:MAG: AI-2E family transporter [Prevotella sp.]|nr:AI-2E family transporter [Prevotella sp.]
MLEKKITFDRFIRWIVIGGIVILSLFVLNYLSAVLLPFFIAWVLAYLMYPLVIFIEKRLHVKVRAISIILAMLAVIAMLSGVIYLIIPPMIEQFSTFTRLATTYLHQAAHIDNIPEAVTTWVNNHSTEIEKYLKSDDFSQTLKDTMPKVFSFIGHTWSVVVSIAASCIVLLYMFFILLDYEYLTKNWIRIFPKSTHHFWQELAQDAANALNAYVRGQCLVALTMGILFCIGFTIIGFPMAIGLGILIGILDLVPYLHTFALIPTAFLAGLKALDTGQSFWMVFGLALLVFAVVQVIIDMVVTPKIMGKQMGLNPAVLLLSLSVWGALLGFIGLIVALPLTTLCMAYWQRYITKEELPTTNEQQNPTEADCEAGEPCERSETEQEL